SKPQMRPMRSAPLASPQRRARAAKMEPEPRSRLRAAPRPKRPGRLGSASYGFALLASGSGCRIGLVGVFVIYEGRGREIGPDRFISTGRIACDIDVADVDDPRVLADAVEEQAEVVVSAFDAHVDRILLV